ncbi:MAG: pilus assembly protein [Deltaproteobacteria bacterium]|nr:MAG: pilus assembly protein [Deltaproteobacteria bacterium]
MFMFRRKRRGANAVEFALTAPVAILILAGIIDFGWFFYLQQGVQTATRDGVRTASVVIDQTQAQGVAQQATMDALTRNGIDNSNATVDTRLIPPPPESDNFLIEVTTEVPFQPLFGLAIQQGQLSMNATLAMRIEARQDPDLDN